MQNWMDGKVTGKAPRDVLMIHRDVPSTRTRCHVVTGKRFAEGKEMSSPSGAAMAKPEMEK